MHAGNDRATLVVHTHPLRMSEREVREVDRGTSLAGVLRDAGYDCLLSAPDENLRIFCGGRRVRKHELMFARPRPGDVVSVAVVATGGGGGGGKNPLRTVLSIALVAAAVMVPGAQMFAGTMFATELGGAVLSAGIMIGGTALINAIAPVQQPKLSGLSGADSAASTTYSLTGVSNQPNPFGVIPRIMGTWHKYHPPLGAESYTEQAGDDQYLRMLCVIGYGPVTVSDIRIGETPISEYDDVEYAVRPGSPSDGPLTIYTQDIHEESLSSQLPSGTAVTRTSEPGVDEISVDISFFQGLFRYNSSGNRENTSVAFRIEYRPTGSSSAWTKMTGADITVSARKNSAFRRSYRAVVARGQYDIRVTRITADATDDKVFNKIAWVTLRSITHTPPIDFSRLPDLATIELRIRASEQLSGQVDTLNMTVTGHAGVWTGSSWTTQATSNPAWWYCDVLCGPAAKNPAPRAMLDVDNIAAWADWCAAHNLALNAVVDTHTTAFELMRDIASVGRASFAYRDNLYSINVEQAVSTPVMQFSHRNSWNFEMSRDYDDLPDALRVRYADGTAGCQQSELIVYADGYTESTAERYDTLELWGVTDADQAARQARFHRADLALRPERYSLSTWISFMRVTRGDRVKMAHPVILVGYCSGRIVSTTTDGSGNVVSMDVDTDCPMVAGGSYAMTAQLLTGEILTIPVDTVEGDQRTLTPTTPVDVALCPGGGELFTFGEAGAVTEDCVITEIVPTDDLTAEITMRPYVPSLYDVDAESYESTVPVISRPPVLQPGAPPLPSIVSVLAGDGQAVKASDGSLRQTMWVTWSLPSGNIDAHHFDVHYRITGETSWTVLPAVTGTARSASLPVEAAYSYDVRVRAVSRWNIASAWVVSSANAVDSVAPGRPTALSVHGQLTQNRLSWTNPDDADLAYIEIWVGQDETDIAAATLLATVPTTDPGELTEWVHGAISPASDYTYWVRAVDTAQNKSGFYPDGAEPTVTAPAYSGNTVNDALAKLTDDSQYETVYRVLADAFMLAKPGYPDTPVFTVGDVDGEPTLGLSGNAIIDGAILARMIAAGEITAEHLAAAQLFIGQSMQSGDYVAGTSGWMVNGQAGVAEFNGVEFTISGGVTSAILTAWAASADQTRIDGGKIHAGSKVVVGNNNIVLDGDPNGTGTPGSGAITVAPDGGPAGQDYCTLNNGDLDFYYWDGTQHRGYKSVKRVEGGVCIANQLFTLPGYWKTLPVILPSIRSCSLYNSNYSAQNQSASCYIENVSVNDGLCSFIPRASLSLSSVYFDLGSTSVYSKLKWGDGEVSSSVLSNTSIAIKTASISASFYAIGRDYAHGWKSWCYIKVNGVRHLVHENLQSVGVLSTFTKSIDVNISGPIDVKSEIVWETTYAEYVYAETSIKSCIAHAPSTTLSATGTLNYIAIGE